MKIFLTHKSTFCTQGNRNGSSVYVNKLTKFRNGSSVYVNKLTKLFSCLRFVCLDLPLTVLFRRLCQVEVCACMCVCMCACLCMCVCLHACVRA